MQRLLRPFLVLLVLAALAFAGLSVRDFLDRPPRAEVAPVVREDVVRVLALTGRIRPQLRNRIAPAVRARLLEVGAEEGDDVAAGDVLARLDARVVEAEISQVRVEIDREQEQLRQNRRDLERARELTDSELLPTSDLEDAQLRVELGERAIERLRRRIGELNARLDDYVLRSPIDGWVLERPIDPGQTVGPGDVIYELATAGDSLVEVEVDEQYLSELHVGQSALLAPLSGRRDPWPAQVVYIGKRIDRLSGAAVIRLAFSGESPELPTGLSLDVNLTIEQHPQALTVPRAAVAGLGSGSSWVLVPQAGEAPETATAKRRDVRVIDWPAPRLVALEGLEEGEQVLLEPKRVGEGASIRPFEDESRSE